ncbi:MAG: YajQ family cyclic di-GMP-binding protein [Pseudomonadota bacterium]
MPSFDIVSKVDSHELANAVDQANREVQTRFDFKNTNANFVLEKDKITLHAQVAFQLKQMMDILQGKLSKRGIDRQSLKIDEPQTNLHAATQVLEVKQGIDQDTAKKIVKQIKDTQIKVQASIHGDCVRVTGKKRDDLQSVMQFLKAADIGLPIQFNNFRD